MFMYGYLLLIGANQLSDGSELLLEILDPGVIGGMLLTGVCVCVNLDMLLRGSTMGCLLITQGCCCQSWVHSQIRSLSSSPAWAQGSRHRNR